jgi:transcriptional regulator with XRE-family HTH domain
MPHELEEKVARFLRTRRGQQTYAAFARRLGLPPSTLFRLENQQQSPTLRILEQILDRLKCDYQEVFGVSTSGGSLAEDPATYTVEPIAPPKKRKT